MKKFTLLLTTLLVCCTSIAAFGQDNDKVQQALDAHQKKLVYKAQLAEDVVGWRLGAEYSMRRFNTLGVFPATKHGLHFVGGYRFTKRWYVGGIAGVEATTPFTIIQDAYAFESDNFEMPREDKIYGSLMLDVRFYMNIARASTYLFTNLGAEYSRDLQKIGTFGLGIDIHTTKSQCVNIGLGLGLGGWHSAHNGDIIDEGPQHGYGPHDGFVCNIKLGYTF